MLRNLTNESIDKPIVDLINGFNKLPHRFILQSCYGHFVYNGQTDPHNLDPLPSKDIISSIEYRIAYIAFCIENSLPGRKLFEMLRKIKSFDPENIQSCCAEWFWKRQVNSYVLQVEPDRLNLPATSCGESPTVKEFSIFYSLAKPAASSGECARYSVQVRRHGSNRF